MQDFTDIDYLREGNPVQRRCYGVLKATRILELLSDYRPVVVGTIPIGIDIPGSDIDILCQAGRPRELGQILREQFSSREEFECHVSEDTLVCSFFADGMEIEVFGQDVPVVEQNGYRHMLAEYALLERYGTKFRDKIIALKRSGMKTEPAFAAVLGLDGDPYEAVLEKGREMGLF